MRNICLYAIVLSILIQSCGQNGKKDEIKYYALNDFASVEKIDMHIHFNTDDPAFVNLSKEDNFRLIGIVDDRPFGTPMQEQQKYAVTLRETFPEWFNFVTTFPVNEWDKEYWTNSTISYLNNYIDSGATAVKIWKNIGMDLKNASGKFVMMDDPKLDPVYDFLAKNNITVVGHNGEPRDCWLPLEQMTVKGNRNYYSEHPEYHMFLHPEYPSYEAQIAARDNVLKKHPDLKFISLHLASLEWSLEEIAKRLDEYPNLAVELSRMANLHIHAKLDWQKTRDFFIKYQDRLIYGTDRSVNKTNNLEGLKKNVHSGWRNDWKFFATDELINDPGIDGEIKGLKLPADVIDKIFRINVETWIPGY